MDVLFLVLDVLVRIVGSLVILAAGVFLCVLLWDLIINNRD